MASSKDILNEIKEKEVKYVDYRFTDTRGKMQHVTFDINLIDEDALEDGLMFDGSSIAGWRTSIPSSSASSTIRLMSKVTCCILPRVSVNRSRRT